jgi:hypothetical protein
VTTGRSIVFAILIASSATDAEAALFTGSAAACEGRLARLSARLDQTAATAQTVVYLPVSPGFQPPRLKSGERPASIDAIIEVAASRALIDGRPVEAPPGKLAAAISNEVTANRDRWRILHPNQKPPRARIGLWLDGRDSAGEAALLVERLSSRSDTVLLGIDESLEPAQQPRPADVVKRLSAIDAETSVAAKSRLTSVAIGDALAGCAGHDRRVQNQGSGGRLHESTLAVVRRCACVGVDMDLLEALLAPVVPAVAGRSVQIRPGAAVTLELPRSATVQEMITAIPPARSFSIHWRERR